jgi:uncharacterized protein
MSIGEKFAIVTGASTGIGYELAKRCLEDGYDVLMAADEPQILDAVSSLRGSNKRVEGIEVDLSTTEGVDKLYEAAKGRPVDALLANAGRGLGHAFLDQDFARARLVIDTNITGTVYLIHKIANDMRHRDQARFSLRVPLRASSQAVSKRSITARRPS